MEDNILEGTVENIIFYNNENGYTVFSFKSDDIEEGELTCTGIAPEVREGEYVTISGQYVTHNVYGKQFNVKTIAISVPKSEAGIEKYLASGVIKGIGKRMAKKIVDRFGAKTLEIMGENPEKLAEIRGISLDKAIKIGEIYTEQAGLRDALMFLGEYGISTAMSLRIYKRYKSDTIKIIKTNPYILADTIYGIGFKTADDIAFKSGVSPNSPDRIKAGIRYILSCASSDGSVYLPQNELIYQAENLLSVAPEYVEHELAEMQFERKVQTEKTENGQIVFLQAMYDAEVFTAKKLLELSLSYSDADYDYEKEIKRYEINKEINLAADQRKAVKEAMTRGVLVITGGPGTGKTTTIKTIIGMLEGEGYEITLAAPTGRAAKRMTEATGIEAQTIHRLLEISHLDENSGRSTFERNRDNPIESDVIIIDEMSMVDIMLMRSLLDATALGTRLILVGDVDQLPSVGAGNVLRDIIESGCINVVRLTEIFRQAQKSAIVVNAHRINNGIYPVASGKDGDFFIMKRYNADELAKTVAELAEVRLPKFLNEPCTNIQVLTPMRKSALGVERLNPLLQERLNPPSFGKKEKEYRGTIFREGDKVMQIKNNYTLTWQMVKGGKVVDEGAGVFNGDEGIIKSISESNETIEVMFFDGKRVFYEYSRLDEIELSYAVTIHKSQGSEYSAVIIPIHSGPEMLFSRNLLYTAVTRAKKLAVLVGIPEMICKMVDNNKEIGRYSYLSQRLKNLNYLFEN